MKAENIKLYKQLEEMLLHKYEQLGLDEFGRERKGLGSIFTFLKQKATTRDVEDEKYRLRITQELLADAKPEQTNLEDVKRDEEKKEAPSGQTEIKKAVSSSSTTTENYVSDEEFNKLLLQYLNDNYYFTNDKETLGKYHYLILNCKPQLGIDLIKVAEERAAQSSSSTFNREKLIGDIAREASSETRNIIGEAFSFGLKPFTPHP